MRRGGPLDAVAFGACAACAAIFTLAPLARGATYSVGPTRRYPDLQSVARLLAPGDRVEVDGGATYPGGVILREGGTRDARITIVGVRSGDRRPVLAGGVNTLEVRGAHVTIEGFEITGGTSRCLYHHGDDLVVRDVVIHDCPGQGILSSDADSGSLTLAYVEVYRAGHGEMQHPIYVASDEATHPGSVFRMEHCYIHDGDGGNNVKSRAERNEIYSNWIEGAKYHEVELIGPDGVERKHAREDSDVVGNVIRKTGPGWAIRVGGDGSGETFGRYRFVNNTVLLGPAASGAFRLFNGLECIEMHNNAIVREGGGPVRVLVEQDVHWAAGRRVVTGANNWVPFGSTGVPPEWRRTLFGLDARLASPRDPRPLPGSPLIGAAEADPAEPLRFAFPAPLKAPRDLPPLGALERLGTAVQRLRDADIGAFPYGADADRPSPPLPTTPVPPAAPGPPPAPPTSCACRALASARRSLGAALGALGLVALVPLRRRRRRRRA